MRLFRILRVSQTDDGTFGVFLADYNLPFALTLERKWLYNKKDESCIPPGDYICQRITSPKFGETFEITHVQNRTHVLFHKGNIQDNSRGCILVGESFDPVGKGYGITHSGDGFAEFLQRLNKVQQFRLVIDVSSLLIEEYTVKG